MAVALHVIQPETTPATCDCMYGSCSFTVSRVYWYMIVWRDAQLLREPFEIVLRDCSITTGMTDPTIRGGRIQTNKGQDIRLSLERARDEGKIPLTPWNASKIAKFLCPDRHTEESPR